MSAERPPDEYSEPEQLCRDVIRSFHKEDRNNGAQMDKHAAKKSEHVLGNSAGLFDFPVAYGNRVVFGL